MNLDIKNKFFYSLISSYGYEFGKKYEVIDVLNTEKYNEKFIKDLCIIVVDKQDGSEKGDQFFATMFNVHFTDDYKKLIESIRDKILFESKELDRLRPIKEDTDRRIEESESEINKLRDLSRNLHLNKK
jgi:hypothetical protein